MGPERLQKLLARRGLASRREAETWIAEGRVSVNGQVVRELGTKVEAGVDRVEVDGVPIPGERQPVVVVLNKPAGYVTTVRDPHAEHTVMELLTGLGRRVYPVGRLDRDTRGVLVLTDDGDLAHALLHPSRGVEKVYEVTATGDFPEEALRKLAAGVELEDGHVTRPVKISEVRNTAGGVRFLMTLKEGHKRQVRQMVRAVGGRVMELVRVSFGGLTVEGMKEGAWRLLKREEVKRLKGGGAAAAPKKAGKTAPGAPERKAPERKAPERKVGERKPSERKTVERKPSERKPVERKPAERREAEPARPGRPAGGHTPGKGGVKSHGKGGPKARGGSGAKAHGGGRAKKPGAVPGRRAGGRKG